MGGTFVEPFLPPAQSRGTEPESYFSPQAWIDYVTGLFHNTPHLIDGVMSGLVFGKPILKDGKEIGRAPGLMPADTETFSRRFENAVWMQTAPLTRPHILFPAIAQGLWNEIKGLWDMIWNARALFGMIRDGIAAIAADMRKAFALGEAVGGGLVEKMARAAEGPFDGFVQATGELIGSLLPDLIAAFFTGGGYTALKGGARVGARVAKQSLDMATELARRGGKQLDEMGQAVAEALVRGPELAMPGPGGTLSPNAVFSEVAQGTANRGTRMAPKGGGGPAPAPSSASPATGGPAAPGKALAGGLGSGAAGKAGRSAAAAALERAATQARRAMQAARRGDTHARPRPEGWVPDPTFSTPPMRGAWLDQIMQTTVLPPGLADLRLLLSDMTRAAGTGGVHYIEAVVLKAVTRDHAPKGLEIGRRVIATHSTAILQKRPKITSGNNAGKPIPRNAMPEYNKDIYWADRRRWQREMMAELEILTKATAPELLPDLRRRWQALHSLGPGAGDELALGMGLGADWINTMIQAGGFRNARRGIANRTDARAGVAAHAPEMVGRQIDGYGAEGFYLDLMRTVEGGVKSGRFPPGTKVHLDTFTESWGDELLESALFAIARERNLRLKPQDFLRSAEYRARLVHPDGDRFRAIPGSAVAIRLDLAPPPYFEKVTVSNLADDLGLLGGPVTDTLWRADFTGN
ncbi:hypothetical protein [Roseibaca sp. Y0-43]|uniref:hypothetical protein n=1 Tax=Roseibaca sp. Y0-43 TaxID=2816854 RepID=UPI001D0CA62D|nr:hypothetical protein [Roseibaca sp. Y0-43]MCC1480786.1 hypothetical protein [Roseibaca sp. Y0-43]